VDLQLKNKIALVTGSTAGIGFAIGSGLAGEGATVIINGRTEKRVSQAIATIRQRHPQARLEACAGDLSTADTVQQVVRRFARVDILINNLGVYEPKPFEVITDQEWREIIETNFMSGVRLSRHYLPEMRATNWGRIIFISSESAINIPVEMIHYGVTKTMQLALARGLAETTAGTAVTVSWRVQRALTAWKSSWIKSLTPEALNGRASRKSSSQPFAPARCSSASHRSKKSRRW
jgi:NAD(P)-dependent dehydrogenase (short-subunit alcohol dehydrogenase family)